MSHLLRRLKSLLASMVCLFVITSVSFAQGDGDVEARFIAMLKNATLKGTWAPVQQGRLGAERNDGGYRIARVEKGEGGKWTIVSVFTVKERELEFPISATVKFAGDTAVLILNDVQAGPGKANWSARILFFDDIYTGRWWETANKEHGGTITGTIVRSN